MTEDTLARLEEICKEMGLSKSQALSMLVNKEYLEKYQDENKVFRMSCISSLYLGKARWLNMGLINPDGRIFSV